MTFSEERKKEIEKQVRRCLVEDKKASSREIAKKLDFTDHKYICKVINKIRKERAERFNHYTIDKVLSEYQDNSYERKRELLEIKNTAKNPRVKINAIRELRNEDTVMFNMIADAGVFERKLGELSVKDKTAIKNLDNLPKDVQRKYYAKIAEAEALTRSDSETGEGKD